MSHFTEEQLQQALRQCEAEPIHQISQIQPHGALLVLSADSQRLVLQASENLANFFDLPVNGVLGRPLVELLGTESALQIEQLIRNIGEENTITGLVSVILRQEQLNLQVRLFASGGMFVLELLHDDAHQTDGLQNLLALMKQALPNSDTDTNICDYFDQIVTPMRMVTGFDRVMAYRFDANWDGEVIAESRVETAASYLGLHFPASDIPPQARRLYTCNLVRDVADVDSQSVSILPVLNPVSKEPLDMSYSTLRSFSPVHIEYLKNMGVQATMSISLLQDGQLWGLIVCHHMTAKRVTNTLHDVADFISRMVTVKLTSIMSLERGNQLNKALHIVGELLEYITTDDEAAILTRLLPELMNLSKATGILMLVEGKRYQQGDVPDEEAANDLLTWLGKQAKLGVFSSNHLSQHFKAAHEYEDIASGLLATPITNDMRNCIIFLRKERLRTVHWAGKAKKTFHTKLDGALHISPRKSFEVWTEASHGCSVPWSPVKITVAEMLGVALTEALSQKSRLEQALETQRQVDADLRIAAIAFDSQEGAMICDVNGIILRVNRAFTKITGYSAEEVIGKNPRILQSGIHDKYFYLSMWDKIKNTGSWHGEICNRCKHGGLYTEWLNINVVTDADGQIISYVGTFADLTATKKAEELINNLAFHNPLTGLPNRRFLIERLQLAMNAITRKLNYSALLFIDLDNFKELNDIRGHDIGDLMLIEVGNRLQRCAGNIDTVACLGGDDFVIMLEELSVEIDQAATQANSLAEKVRLVISQPFNLSGVQHHISVSIGISLFRDNEISIDHLLKYADTAMYQAKQSGRNTICFFDPATHAANEARIALAADLRLALPNSEFQLYYQMQVENTGKILGAEVLIRWNHPERGMVSPVQFISLAEESGLILPIGLWVLETACAQLKRWEQDDHAQHLQLAVNVSALQFRQPDFVAQVCTVLEKKAIRPERLKLELTESLVLDNVDDTILKMKTLRKIGVHFSMDDFGTGFSSLAYLTQLPLDQLKIDQSFVRNIGVKPTDAVIVQTIIGMAKNLDMNVIAEGVETEQQRDFLEKNSCTHYQGYLFGKPVPLDEFEAVLKLDSRNRRV
jgi:diguanylate cyclase (GGDEF)-like protein/PAS domain S-box-containing protein